MHSGRTVRAALELARSGSNATEVARQLAIPRRTVADWLRGSTPQTADPDAGCKHEPGDLPPDYVYLLGMYLGDGCISKHHRGVHKLRIFLDVKYPGIIASTAAGMRLVKGGSSGVVARPRNCVEVYSFWKCWPHLFPQHGPGKIGRRSWLIGGPSNSSVVSSTRMVAVFRTAVRTGRGPATPSTSYPTTFGKSSVKPATGLVCTGPGQRTRFTSPARPTWRSLTNSSGRSNETDALTPAQPRAADAARRGAGAHALQPAPFLGHANGLGAVAGAELLHR